MQVILIQLLDNENSATRLTDSDQKSAYKMNFLGGTNPPSFSEQKNFDRGKKKLKEFINLLIPAIISESSEKGPGQSKNIINKSDKCGDSKYQAPSCLPKLIQLII